MGRNRKDFDAEAPKGPVEMVSWTGEDEAGYNLPISQLNVNAKGKKKAVGKYIGTLIKRGTTSKPKKGTVRFNKTSDQD